jgi:hypothetical protein
VSLRQLALWVAFWTLVLFYAPVVALIQAPVNMDNLMKVTIQRSINIHAVLLCCCTDSRPWIVELNNTCCLHSTCAGPVRL